MVSPLIALMQDQSIQLPTVLPSIVLSGCLDSNALIEITNAITSTLIKILFISPERLFSSFFKKLLTSTSLLQQIKLVVVDEAHCVSSWSFNFRADYLRIYRLVDSIRQGIPLSLLHCFIASFIHSLLHSLTHSLIHSFTLDNLLTH